MAWIRRQLRGALVHVRVTDDGEPVVAGDGRVEIVYKLAPGAKVYRAALRNLARPDDDDGVPVEMEIDSPGTQETPPRGATGKRASPAKPDDASSVPQNAVIIYTDGSCTGNPGPMGLGAVLLDGETRVELSEYLGIGTNNIAELTAILRALQNIEDSSRSRPILIHSDSSYAIGLLSKGWKAKANKELVSELRETMADFDDVRFVKVKAHVGIPENERCDELARLAVENTTEV